MWRAQEDVTGDTGQNCKDDPATDVARTQGPGHCVQPGEQRYSKRKAKLWTDPETKVLSRYYDDFLKERTLMETLGGGNLRIKKPFILYVLGFFNLESITTEGCDKC